VNPGEPTRDQLLAMAYVDGELAPSARAEFEARLAAQPELRREVSALKELELFARAAAPREPQDHEWDALARDPLQRGALGLGWTLLGLGALVALLFGGYELVVAEMPTWVKFASGAISLGLLLLFGATLRARARTAPLDPYRKVQR
jgi:anti-sigma factor RsiW